jgi:hypothetical protein
MMSIGPLGKGDHLINQSGYSGVSAFADFDVLCEDIQVEGLRNEKDGVWVNATGKT